MMNDNVAQDKICFAFTIDECLVLLDSLIDSKDYLTEIYSRNPYFGNDTDFATKIYCACIKDREVLVERLRMSVEKVRSMKFVHHRGI